MAERTDLVFPLWQRNLVKTIPANENLRCDRGGLPRTAYSLGHTCICLRLMEGADIYQIAENCRTSVESIEKIPRGASQDLARRCCHPCHAAQEEQESSHGNSGFTPAPEEETGV